MGSELVIAEWDSSGDDARFTIRRTLSLSSREMLIFFILVCIVTFAINIGFLLVGAWLVLPFAGLELMTLGLALWVVFRSGERVEIVTIKGEDVRVLKQDRKISEEWHYQRYWAQAVLLKDKSWYPSKLFIRSHGRAMEIGKCLTDQERERLAIDLKQIFNKPVTG